MALSDTAELIVALKLRDQITGGLNNVNRQLGSMDRTLQTVSTRVSRTGQALSTALGVGLERLAEGGLRLLASSLRTGVEEMQRLEDANLQTQAAIESTGGAAGQSAAGVRQMAEDFEALNATFDDKAIQEGANVLLTFRKISGDTFEEALEAALDLSVAFDQDLQTSVKQIGRALEDPIRGVTALRRAGVQLTAQQEDQIRTLVEQNRLYDAQQIILRELNVQVGGRFEAQGQGDAARAAALSDRIEDLQRTFAEGLAPGLTRVREALIGAFENPQVIAGVRAVGDAIANFLSAENLQTAGQAVQDVFGFLGQVPWGAIGDGLRIVGSGAKLAIDAFNSLPREVQGVVVAGLAVNRLAGGAIGDLAGAGIKALFNSLRTIIAGHVTVVGRTVGGPPGGPSSPGGKFPLIAAATAVALPLILKSSENLTAEQGNRLTQLTKQIEEGAITSAEAARLWMEAYGQVTDNPFRIEPPDLTFLGESFARNIGRVLRDTDLGARKVLPGFSEARNVTNRAAATALQPLTSAISELRQTIAQGKGGPTGATGGPFVETVKLDPSQVTDLRKETAIAAKEIRTLTVDARAADTANRTANAFLTAEAIKTRAATVERLTTLAGKYDVANAQLGSANKQLGSINAKTPPTHPVTVNNSITIPVSISATLIEQQLVTAKMAKLGIPTAPTIL